MNRTIARLKNICNTYDDIFETPFKLFIGRLMVYGGMPHYYRMYGNRSQALFFGVLNASLDPEKHKVGAFARIPLEELTFWQDRFFRLLPNASFGTTDGYWMTLRQLIERIGHSEEELLRVLYPEEVEKTDTPLSELQALLV